MTIDTVWLIVSGIFGAGAAYGGARSKQKGIARTVERIEGKLDTALDRIASHDTRLAVLENYGPPAPPRSDPLRRDQREPRRESAGPTAGEAAA